MDTASTTHSIETIAAGNGGKRALDLSVVVPVRNAENLIEECLASIIRSGAREVILVEVRPRRVRRTPIADHAHTVLQRARGRRVVGLGWARPGQASDLPNLALPQLSTRRTDSSPKNERGGARRV